MVMSPDKGVEVRLSSSEALLLFEWLTSRSEPGGSEEPLSTALEVVLVRLEGQIERQLPELFAPDYDEILQRAPGEVLARADSDESLSAALAAKQRQLCKRCGGTGREATS